MSLHYQHSQISAPRMPHKINLVLMELSTKYIGQFNRIGDKLFRRECAVDVLAIGFACSPAVPLDDHKFLFKLVLKCVSQIHGRHPWTAVKEEQDWERRIVTADENVLIYTPDADAFQRSNTVRPGDGGSASRSEPQITNSTERRQSEPNDAPLGRLHLYSARAQQPLHQNTS